MSWTDERIEKLTKMWEGGATASQIADELGGVSRNAVIGKAHRLGLKARPSPVKPNEKEAPAPAPTKAPKAEAAPRAAQPAPRAAPMPRACTRREALRSGAGGLLSLLGPCAAAAAAGPVMRLRVAT
ncbi:MAG TPA: GcrA family cell cycle regulator, partial [Novosphingobium sp.]|nr:GcrA family cell cycle regulator [Novosphingobium sp.]